MCYSYNIEGGNMKVIFISGPYRAKTTAEIDNNIQRARQVAMKLWKEGWIAYCPHMNTAHFDGLCPDNVWLEGNLEILRRCDAIYMMDGWMDSEGSIAEYNLAKELNLIMVGYV